MGISFLPSVAAAMLGVVLARKDGRYRPMSRALLLLVGTAAGRYATQALRPGTAERVARYAAGLPVAPYEGLARASWAVEQVAVLAWYAVLSWAVWRALKDEAPETSPVVDVRSEGLPLNHPDSNRSPTRGGGLGVTLSRATASHCRDVGRARSIYLASALLASSVLLFLAYPIIRGRAVELAATVVFCAALAVQLAAATNYILHWRRPDAAQGVALVLVAGSVADAAGPWILAHPARDWFAGEPVGVLIWLVTGGCGLCTIARKRGR